MRKEKGKILHQEMFVLIFKQLPSSQTTVGSLTVFIVIQQ